MKLTTLGEGRIRGDLIETFKIVNGIVEYGKNIFRLSSTNRNIIRKTNKIEGNSNYLVNKQKFNQFLAENPYIARKKGINTYTRTTGCLN